MFSGRDSGSPPPGSTRKASKTSPISSTPISAAAATTTESSYGAGLVRDRTQGMKPRSLLTGFYGSHGERIRHIVHDGAMQLPLESLETIMEQTLPRDYVAAATRKYDLPGLDSVIRPCADLSLGSVLVTELSGVLVPPIPPQPQQPQLPGTDAADVAPMLEPNFKTVAVNKVLNLATPSNKTIVAIENTERIRGGGGEHDEGGQFSDKATEKIDKIATQEATATPATDTTSPVSNADQAFLGQGVALLEIPTVMEGISATAATTPTPAPMAALTPNSDTLSQKVAPINYPNTDGRNRSLAFQPAASTTPADTSAVSSTTTPAAAATYPSTISSEAPSTLNEGAAPVPLTTTPAAPSNTLVISSSGRSTITAVAPSTAPANTAAVPSTISFSASSATPVITASGPSTTTATPSTAPVMATAVPLTTSPAVPSTTTVRATAVALTTTTAAWSNTLVNTAAVPSTVTAAAPSTASAHTIAVPSTITAAASTTPVNTASVPSTTTASAPSTTPVTTAAAPSTATPPAPSTRLENTTRGVPSTLPGGSSITPTSSLSPSIPSNVLARPLNLSSLAAAQPTAPASAVTTSPSPLAAPPLSSVAPPLALKTPAAPSNALPPTVPSNPLLQTTVSNITTNRAVSAYAKSSIASHAAPTKNPVDKSLVQSLPTKPESQWAQMVPEANDEALEPKTPRPPWYNSDRVSSFERTMLPEWFDGSATHRTEQSYRETREQIMTISDRLGNRNVTATLIRRSIVGDAGSLIRLHNFLNNWGLINEDAINDTMPTGSGLRQEGSALIAERKRNFWDSHRRDELIEAVVDESMRRKRPKLSEEDMSTEDSFIPIDWDAVAAKVGHGVSSLDCEREFLSMPIQESAKSVVPGERSITPDISTAEQRGASSDAESLAAMRESIFREIVDQSKPDILHAVTEAALKATNHNLAEAQRAAIAGLVASKAAARARSEEDAMARILSELVDQRMQKIENRMALMDDIEGILEAERVCLELERRDLYTARCRHWFGGT